MPSPLKDTGVTPADVALLEEVRCGVCGSDQYRFLFLGRDYIYGNEGTWPVAQCTRCGVVFMNPRIPPSSIGRYYPSDYYTTTQATVESGVGWRRNLRNALLEQQFSYRFEPTPPFSARVAARLCGWVLWRLDSVQRYIQWVPNGRMLDVGCGSGAALNGYSSLGWQTYGSEVSESSARCATKAGHQIFVGELVGARYPSDSFDAVTFWDTLEHVHNPRETLEETRRILKPGGRVYISVPNAGSIYWRAIKDKWFMFTCPLHYYHYTRETLGHLLRLAGFEVVRLLASAGHAGLAETVSILASGSVSSGCRALPSWVRGCLRRVDKIAPWGHLIGVARKPTTNDHTQPI